MEDIEKAISEEAVKAVKDYVDLIVKAPLKELGGLLSDQVSHWRFRNRFRAIAKTKKLLEDKGIDPQKVLPDIFVPLIEEVGNISDETLSDMFSNLLANHLDGSNQVPIHPSFTKMLGQLSPLDAAILNGLYKAIARQKADYRKNGYTLEIASKAFSVSEASALLSFENLWRIGICDRGADPLVNLNRKKQIVFTEWGWSFMEACTHL